MSTEWEEEEIWAPLEGEWEEKMSEQKVLAPTPYGWQILGKWCYRRRKAVFGAECLICNGCPEIILCEGPISFEVCQTVEDLVAMGRLKFEGQPKGSLWLDRGGRLPSLSEEQWRGLLKTAQDYLYAIEEKPPNDQVVHDPNTGKGE